MNIDMSEIQRARKIMLSDTAPVTALIIQAYSNLTAASTGTRPCTSCCTQCAQLCCFATYG